MRNDSAYKEARKAGEKYGAIYRSFAVEGLSE
jgi:hypothetical protein